MKQWLYAIAGAVMLAGCASAGKGGTDTVVQVVEDKTQALKTIEFAPQPLECDRALHCPTLAVRWSSATPKRAVLLVGVPGGPVVEEVVFHARPHPPQRVRSKSSQTAGVPGMTAFDVPMDTLERIAFAKGTWVEVSAGGKTLREDMSTGEKRSAADMALKRLMVEAYKGTDKETALSLTEIFGKPYER